MLTHDSMPMRLSKYLGLTRIAWALRRLHCPVPSEALVLEVGSGGNPYARANVLLDAYEVTGQRHWAPLVSDRPTVLGFVESLPFKDKAFDFVIASHVLEHSSEPERFLAELQRVAKAGYIEVPDAFMERINPYRDHRLEVTLRNGGLVIRKKPDWREYFSVYGEGQIDLRTVFKDVLLAISGSSENDVTRFIRERDGGDGIPGTADDRRIRDEEAEQLLGLTGDKLNALRAILNDDDTTLRRITSVGWVGDKRAEIIVVTRRNSETNAVTYLGRMEE